MQGVHPPAVALGGLSSGDPVSLSVMADPHRWDPDWVMKPGEHLQEWMDEDGITMLAAASVCGLSVDTIFGVLDASVQITPSVAKGLERGTNIPEGMWLNLERIYREGLAAGKKVI